MNPSGSNDDLVRRITMESSREPRGFNGNAWCQMETTDARILESDAHPLVNSNVQTYTTQCSQLGNLPTRNHANAKPSTFVLL
jgi:hypothetical protein